MIKMSFFFLSYRQGKKRWFNEGLKIRITISEERNIPEIIIVK